MKSLGMRTNRYLAVSRTARGDGETDSTWRRCAPQPQRHRTLRYHVSYCVLPAGERFGGNAKHSKWIRHRKFGPPARCPGGSAAGDAVLGAAECQRVRVEPELHRDGRLRSVGLPRECRDHSQIRWPLAGNAARNRVIDQRCYCAAHQSAAAQTLPAMDGVIGISALSARRVHFDFTRQTLSWE